MRLRGVAVALVLIGALVVGALVYVRGHPGYFPWAFRYRGDWRAALVDRTEDADGIRVRESGWGEDKLLGGPDDDASVFFEGRGADLVRDFLDRVRIDDRASGDSCMCVGGTRIDILRGESIAASFAFKHGSALRSERLWPGHAQLTAESAEEVCEWLVARGVDVESPRRAAARIAAEKLARESAQDAVLGRERAESLRAAPDQAAAEALLATWAPDPAERVLLALRFLATELPEAPDPDDRTYWSVRQWFDEFDDVGAWTAAFDRALSDEALALGAARRFYDLDRFDRGAAMERALAGLRERAAGPLLDSSIDYDRVRGLELLGCGPDTPEFRATVLGLLPSGAEGVAPASPPTKSQVAAASLAVRFCDPSRFQRLQALADAADVGESRRMSQRIAARRNPTGVRLKRGILDVLPSAPVEGVVRAADGTVVAGASVRLVESWRKPGKNLRPVLDGKTDESGRYRLEVPLGRTWQLSVVHDEHPYLLRKDVDLRSPPARMDLALPRERTIRGRVLDADGRPVPGARIHAERLTPFHLEHDAIHATAGEDGTFELRGFDAEAPEVGVGLSAFAPGPRCDTSTSPPQEFTLRAHDLSVELRVRPRK